jgi:ABC-type Fe3+/spermidine/putrescine transport system ATPase subunit
VSSTGAPAVEVVSVEKRFGDHDVLHGIDLAITPREFISLLGPSGCGKTTLLRIIAGFESPTRGRVRIHGADMTTVPPHRRPTNIVFQRGALFPHMNVAENIGYSLKLRRWPKARIAARVEELLALVRLEGLGSRGATQLSGGQIQRAALARALAPEPEVLLLDEPLSALDLKLRQHMQLELRALHRQLGSTFIYVTHDQVEAMVMSDRIAVMNEGRLVQLGSPRDIYTRPTSVFASDFIGDTNLVRGTVVASDGRRVELVTLGGATVSGEASEAIAVGRPVTLSVRPASVRVSRAETDAALDGTSGLAAVIAELIYLGDRIRVEADAGAGLVVSADLREAEADGLERTMPVRLEWAPNAASVWADRTDDTGQEER